MGWRQDSLQFIILVIIIIIMIIILIFIIIIIIIIAWLCGLKHKFDPQKTIRLLRKRQQYVETWWRWLASNNGDSPCTNTCLPVKSLKESRGTPFGFEKETTIFWNLMKMIGPKVRWRLSMMHKHVFTCQKSPARRAGEHISVISATRFLTRATFLWEYWGNVLQQRSVHTMEMFYIWETEKPCKPVFKLFFSPAFFWGLLCPRN